MLPTPRPPHRGYRGYSGEQPGGWGSCRVRGQAGGAVRVRVPCPTCGPQGRPGGVASCFFAIKVTSFWLQLAVPTCSLKGGMHENCKAMTGEQQRKPDPGEQQRKPDQGGLADKSVLPTG